MHIGDVAHTAELGLQCAYGGGRHQHPHPHPHSHSGQAALLVWRRPKSGVMPQGDPRLHALDDSGTLTRVDPGLSDGR